ncbi:hypothetical protein FQA47_018131 [Oryzias melastigma]|uniref:Uncharacterized protein n=1 Tax=Oryzias melastigma TaxID=30732 RepID=A0A834BVH6_ORYME|nr:hypothetical protein FQA47_018131 [Oryzias melastigma]
MRHLLAVNQGSHPGAIDGAVSLCETCLSKPTHSATPPGQPDIRLLSSFSSFFLFDAIVLPALQFPPMPSCSSAHSSFISPPDR